MTQSSSTVPADLKQADRRHRRSAARHAVAAVVLFGLCLSGAAAEPPEEQQKPDWAGLTVQLENGDWAAAAATADRIATQVEPKRRAPDYLPRSILLIQALMARGRAELGLGDLDAAEATLLEAYRTFKDRDFQRLFSIQARLPKNIAEVVALRMTWVELLDLRSQVILERLRHANLDARRSADRASTGQPAKLDEWLEELGRLGKFSTGAREELAAILDKGGAKVLTSPRCRALVGSFHPDLHDGIKALELSKLARVGGAGASRDGDATAATATGAASADELLAAARESFKAARGELDAAMQAAQPKGVTGMKPEQRIEAAVLETALLTDQAAALLEAGEPAAARANLEKVLELKREVARIRKRDRADGHPDTLRPLLMAAEVSLAESQRSLADGVADKARAEAVKASELLDQAGELNVPDSQPLVAERLRLVAELDRQRAAVGKSIPRSDAADTAARRVLRAVDASRSAGVSY